MSTANDQFSLLRKNNLKEYSSTNLLNEISFFTDLKYTVALKVKFFMIDKWLFPTKFTNDKIPI